MRENRPYGSEGGGTGNQPVLPTPIKERRLLHPETEEPFLPLVGRTLRAVGRIG
jgi:hypothetical protein